MTGDRPTTPGWHCHRCRSTSCRQRADSDTDHVGRVEYRPLLLTQPSSVSWLWSHTHWCPSQRPQEVMRVDGRANPTMPKNPAQYGPTKASKMSPQKSVSRVCCSSAACARCRDAPLAGSVHSLGPRECTDPTGVSRLDAVLEMELPQTRRRACHRRRPGGGDGV